MDETPRPEATMDAQIAELTEHFGSGDMVRAAALSVGYRQPDTEPKLGSEITNTEIVPEPPQE